MSDVESLKPLVRSRLYELVAHQILEWATENGLRAGDRLPAERELAAWLGVSRATVSQALVAMEVVGVVAVRHGDGSILVDSYRSSRLVDAIRTHAQCLPEIIEARAALETPRLLARLMGEISDLNKETRIESLSQPGRPKDSLEGHRRFADAIRAGDVEAAATATHDYVTIVSDVALLRN